jgi:hypothetical protein
MAVICKPCSREGGSGSAAVHRVTSRQACTQHGCSGMLAQRPNRLTVHLQPQLPSALPAAQPPAGSPGAPPGPATHAPPPRLPPPAIAGRPSRPSAVHAAPRPRCRRTRGLAGRPGPEPGQRPQLWAAAAAPARDHGPSRHRETPAPPPLPSSAPPSPSAGAQTERLPGVGGAAQGWPGASVARPPLRGCTAGCQACCRSAAAAAVAALGACAAGAAARACPALGPWHLMARGWQPREGGQERRWAAARGGPCGGTSRHCCCLLCAR